MPLRSPPTTPPRFDAGVERSPDPKHVFDRDPLLIPQLYSDGRPPWYRRTWVWLAILVSFGAASGMGVVVARHGTRGAMTRVAHVGVAVMHTYTRIVAGRTVAAGHNVGR